MSMPTLVRVTLSAIQSGLSSIGPSTKSSWSWSASPSWLCARSLPSWWSATVCRFGLSSGSAMGGPYSKTGSQGSPLRQRKKRLPLLRAIPVVDILAHLVLGDAVPLLDLAFELVALAANEIQIVVGQLAPLLFDLAFDLLPISFHAIPIHSQDLLLLGLALNNGCEAVTFRNATV